VTEPDADARNWKVKSYDSRPKGRYLSRKVFQISRVVSSLPEASIWPSGENAKHLNAYDWPGNIRELIPVMWRA
jgi:hypothetical protein